MKTLKEIFDHMPATFQKDVAANMNVIILFDITGEDGGKWYVTINEGNLSIEEGGFRDPDLTLTVSASDYLDISTGKLNSQLAFMTGRLTATGDLGLAMKMPRIFKE